MIESIKNSEVDNEKLSQLLIPKNTSLEKIDFSKVVVKKPWGHEYLLYDDGNAAAWILYLNKGASTSMHCHLYKKTALVVLKGEAISTTLSEGFILKESDGLVLDKKVFHSTQSISEEGTILLELETPSKKTDVVRLIDLYGRETAGYESESEMVTNFGLDERIFFPSNEEETIKKIGNTFISISTVEENSVISLINVKSSGVIILDGELRDEVNRKTFSRGDLFSISKYPSLRAIRKTKILKIETAQSSLSIKGILFDFDGVIAQTMEDNFQAWKRSYQDHGIQILPEDYFHLEGAKLEEVARIISQKYSLQNISPKEIIEKKERYYRQNNNFAFYPGVVEIIGILKKKGIKMAIVSAGQRERLLSCTTQEFLKNFDAIICGDMVQKGKPDPEPYLTAMKVLNLLPSECIVIENAPLGIESAKNAQSYCIAIASTLKKEVLIQADEIVEKFEDIITSEKIRKILSD